MDRRCSVHASSPGGPSPSPWSRAVDPCCAKWARLRRYALNAWSKSGHWCSKVNSFWHLSHGTHVWTTHMFRAGPEVDWIAEPLCGEMMLHVSFERVPGAPSVSFLELGWIFQQVEDQRNFWHRERSGTSSSFGRKTERTTPPSGKRGSSPIPPAQAQLVLRANGDVLPVLMVLFDASRHVSTPAVARW